MNSNKFSLMFVIALFILLFSALITTPSQAEEIPPSQPEEMSGVSQPVPTLSAPSTSSSTTTTTAGPGSFTLEQTLSDGAQRMTLSFDGLSFTTGSLGADSFFPPGKVADFWGFQYLRDNDLSSMGHNTDFLTKASLNMYTLLTTTQRTQLVNLAKSQVDSINQYGYKRFVLMTAFRRLMSGDLPTGTSGLDLEAVKTFSGELYQLDGQISYERAQVMGDILYNLNTDQKAFLDTNMVGKGMTSWPSVTEPDDMRTLSHDEKVAVMTYAGDLFSWYAGSLDADVYFCPERQGTYFGSFYMKDAPAINNPGYSIDTELTATMGQNFINALTSDQAALITGLVEIQKPSLYNIVTVRTQVSTELRKFKSGGTADLATVLSLMKTYGELDGTIVYNYATKFAQVGNTLSDAQKTTLTGLRTEILGELSTPTSAYLYSTPIALPTVQDTDFLFSTSSSPTCYALTLSGSPTAGGTPTASPTQSSGCSSSGQYVAGESITLSAGTNSGYTFSSWSGASVTSNVLSMPGAATALTANYTVIPTCFALTLTGNPTAGGTPTASPMQSSGCSSNGQYVAGQSITLSAGTNSGYTFSSWSGANVTSNVLIMPSSATALTANYAPLCFALRLIASPTVGGVPTASPTKSSGCSINGQYTTGQSITLSAGTKPKYAFSSWSGAIVTNNVLTMPPAATTLTANYTVIPTCYTLRLTASPAAGGVPTASPTKSSGCLSNGQYVAGQSITLTPVANSGYNFNGWIGATVTNNVLTMRTAAITLQAKYTLIPTCYALTLTANPTTGGTISAIPTKSAGCTTDGTYISGQIVKFTVISNMNYHFDGWSSTLVNATTNQMIIRAASPITANFGTNLTMGAYDDTYAGIEHSASWITENGASFDGGTQHTTTVKGSSVILNFTGTRLGMYYTSGRTYSKITIKIDNGTPYTLNENSLVTAYKNLWLSSILTAGNHKAVITILATNPAKTAVNFDRFLVDMTVAAR